MMNIKKYIGMALLPMVFAACQEDTLVNDQGQGINTLKATVDQSAPMSRAQVLLGGTSTTTETFRWNAGDEMMLLDVSNVEDISKHLFTISSSYDGNSVSADFTTSKALTEGNSIIAVYPTTFSLDDTYGYFINMDVAGHVLDNNSEASWIKYFSENMFMMATGTASEGMSLNMQHLCSLLRITYTNATDSDVQISSINIYGDVCTNRTFHAGDTSYDAGHGGSSDNGIRFANPVTVGAGTSEDFYILTFAYFDHENNNWGGLTGFNFSYAGKSDASTPATYNGQQFVVSNLKAGSSYWFNITETANGIVWTKDVNQGEEEDTIVTFSNTELSAALLGVLGADKVTLNAKGYAEMKKADVLEVKELDFGWEGTYTITSLAGIENFVNLEVVYCNNTGLKECDLSNNKKLNNVIVCESELITLDLTGLTEIRYVACGNSKTFKELILDPASRLGHLECQNTLMEVLNIPNPENMWQLQCGGNPNLHLDFTLYPNLTILGMNNMGLTSLDFLGDLKSQLTWLSVQSNQLTSITLSEFPELEEFDCGGNNLTELNLSGVTIMTFLSCYDNDITTLDISSLTNLTNLVCGNQKNEKTLSLTLTEEQKTSWDNEWLKNNAWGNQNVALDVVDSGVSDKDELSKNVIVKTAGTLSTFINDDEKYVITSLAISGPLNGDDIQFIRDITFTSSSGNPTESTGALHTLDLSNAQIVAGGGAYNAYRPDETVNTQDNIVTAGMFGYSNLRTIVLPSNITEIGESAFETMLSLESIAIPASVTKIGEKAFNTCKKLKSITISENVIEIGSHAFYDCMALTEVIIPSNVATIGSYAFGNCANLTKVYCKALTPPALGVNAFSLCSSLQTVYVPASAVDAYNNADGWKDFQIVVE